MTTEPIIRVTIDLTPNGIRNTTIRYETPEQRDEAIQQLNRCLPQLELLEQALQSRD